MAEARQLRYFVAVVEEGSITRAAQRLHVSQPALSESVRKLEAELQTTLLERTGTGVRPTVAGAELADGARDALGRLDGALDRARRAGRGLAGRLRLGFEASGAGPLGTIARARFSSRFPDVDVEPKRYDWGGEARALRDGEVEVAFVWLPADPAGLHLEVVATEPRLVALPSGHALADRREVSILELRDEPLMWTRRAPRFWVDWWAVNPRPDGSEPRWGPQNDNVEEMLEQVAGGAAVCLAPLSMARNYGRPDLAWVPVGDIDPLRIALGWREGDESQLVRRFAEVVREVAAEQ